MDHADLKTGIFEENVLREQGEGGGEKVSLLEAKFDEFQGCGRGKSIKFCR